MSPSAARRSPPRDRSLSPNAEQATAWDGDEGLHWVRHQDRYEAMAGAFTEPLFAAAVIAETDRVLDVGCGCGQTTRLAARQAARGTALGIDLSGPMLARALDAVAEALRPYERPDGLALGGAAWLVTACRG